MMEYGDVDVRKAELAKLVGIEDKTWVSVDGFDKVYAIANEDLERSTDEKTSAVHFMRFELTPEMAAAAKSGASISAGIDHENYLQQVVLSDDSRNSLAKDLS